MTIAGLLWHLISATFDSLWKGTSHAALVLRLILMVAFAAVIVVAVASVFGLPLLVIFLSAIGSINVLFYSRWVRLSALEGNLK